MSYKLNQVQPPYNTNTAGAVGAASQGGVHAQVNTQINTEVNTMGRIDFLAGQRDVKAFNKAINHSSRVRLLRVLFPVTAILMIFGIGGAYYWKSIGTPTFTVQSTSFDNGNMVMKNPVIKGVDEENRPYELTAKEAVQNTKELTKIELLEINAIVPMEGSSFAKITAGNGLYDSEAKTLLLGGEVDILSDDGMRIILQDADIDIGAGNMFTNNPVIMSSPQAKISADSVAIENNGDSIIFNKNVKMTLYPKSIKSAQASTVNSSPNN